ncbi:MAG TPA: HisA/HisF-related TIM barrel protein, partial [Hyphomicrobium sp.]|nr:HisA/HisF-related TIM barrel protein [Hyphomicrobium sp.]
MDVIPVIDVRHGTAVAAARGDRANYRPLETPLASSSDPVAVARGFARLFTFPVLYVADLDGIEGRGSNASLASDLASVVPDARVWLDEGARPAEAAHRIAEAVAMPVVGTESLAGEADVTALRALPPHTYVLSLDFKDDRFAGPAGVLAETEHWPHSVIVMTLARVGSGEGPDIERISEIVSRAGAR